MSRRERITVADVVQKKCDFKHHRGTKRETSCGKDVLNNEPTVFSIGQTRYEADLCEEHQETLSEDLEPYTSIANKAEKRIGKVVRKAIQGKEGVFTSKDVRLWLRSKGVEVADAGRVSNQQIADYIKAHS
jgi:hypothetical protein